MTDQKREVEAIQKENYFRHLLASYQKLVYTICYRATGNPFDAEDLTQETFLAAYKNLSTFDGAYEKAWICKIASNKCLDFHKSARRRVFPAEEEVFLQIEDQGNSPEQQYLEQEAQDWTCRLCKKLKEPYQTIAMGHFYEGKTAAEIARESGKNQKTVQTQIYRARGMLKKIVKEEEARCRV